jgi:hypothetical protein
MYVCITTNQTMVMLNIMSRVPFDIWKFGKPNAHDPQSEQEYAIMQIKYVYEKNAFMYFQTRPESDSQKH